MSSKARKTGDVFDEQDALARAYKSTAEPAREKERLADVWIAEGSTREGEQAGEVYQKPIRHKSKTKERPKLFQMKEADTLPSVYQKPIRVRSKPKKYPKLYLLKEKNNGN